MLKIFQAQNDFKIYAKLYLKTNFCKRTA